MQRESGEDSGDGRSLGKDALERKSAHKNKVKNMRGILAGTHADEVYSMKYQRIGKCIIFNHTKYIIKADDRPYSDLDAAALKDFFDSRGFDVEIYNNRKVSQINSILENETQNKKEYHNSASCFVCCVLTHGKLENNREYLCAEDGTYPTEKLFDSFAGDKCDSLAGKPKIFFIQACRGCATDPGVNVFYKLLDNYLISRVWAQPQKSSLVPISISEPLLCYKIPVKADFLIAYSTTPKCLTFKRNKEGSWFIQSLCKVLEDRADDSDLLSMLTVVCRKVAYEYVSHTEETEMDNKKQVPSSYSTLTKMVKFPPRKN